MDPLLTTLFGGLIALVAAFAGAWFAYRLERKQRRRELDDSRVAAGNRAVMTLMNQVNKLHNIRTQFIDPKRQDEFRCLTIQASSPLNYGHVRVDLDALAFLVETTHPEILGEVMTADEAFHATIEAFNVRSACHRERVQQLVAAAGVRKNDIVTDASVEELLGHRLYQEITYQTEQAISFVDRTLALTPVTARELRKVLLSELPGRRILAFDAP